MASLLRRFGRWLLREDIRTLQRRVEMWQRNWSSLVQCNKDIVAEYEYRIEPVRAYFRWPVENPTLFARAEVAQARAMLRILDGHDPADVGAERLIEEQGLKVQGRL